MNTLELAARLGLEVTQQLVGAQINVPGTKLTSLDYVTIHDTQNLNRRAGAQFHRNFVATGGGVDHVSFTYTVDDQLAIQILPENWDNWAQGSKVGNDRSLSIELCVNTDADQARARDNLAKLVAAILVANGLDPTRIRQHHDWSGKNCPASIRHIPGGWEALLERVKGYIGMLDATMVAPDFFRIIGQNTVSPTVIDQFLQRIKSPMLDYHTAAEYHDVANLRGVNPGYLIAVGYHESGLLTDYGSVAVTHKTNNISNLRPKKDGSIGRAVDKVNVGTTAKASYFRIYADPMDCWLDMIELMQSPTYAGKSIREVAAIYAPSSDGNKPNAYATTVLEIMDALWTATQKERQGT